MFLQITDKRFYRDHRYYKGNDVTNDERLEVGMVFLIFQDAH